MFEKLPTTLFLLALFGCETSQPERYKTFEEKRDETLTNAYARFQDLMVSVELARRGGPAFEPYLNELLSFYEALKKMPHSEERKEAFILLKEAQKVYLTLSTEYTSKQLVLLVEDDHDSIMSYWGGIKRRQQALEEEIASLLDTLSTRRHPADYTTTLWKVLEDKYVESYRTSEALGIAAKHNLAELSLIMAATVEGLSAAGFD